MIIQERYKPIVMAANATADLGTANSVNGFIAVTAGTITITDRNGTVLLNAFPVTAGAIYGISMFIGHNGGTVTLAGGASGTLLTA